MRRSTSPEVPYSLTGPMQLESPFWTAGSLPPETSLTDFALRAKKKFLINASAVGYYGSRMDDEILDEDSPAGARIHVRGLYTMGRGGEKAARSGARTVLLRFGIVLGRGGGALAMMVPTFRYLLGTSMGSGRQWMSWIHREDLCSIFTLLLNNREISGPLNCVAPNPVRNSEFCRGLAGNSWPADCFSRCTGFSTANAARRVRKTSCSRAKG